MYYTECPECGATLDPGEKCDCKEVKENVRQRVNDSGSGKSDEAERSSAKE